MIVHDSWWSNESVFQLLSTVIDYRVPFGQGLIGICPSSIDDGLHLGIVFAAAVATVAEQDNSYMTFSVAMYNKENLAWWSY